jgi:chemotaxis signal transduction protein
MGTRDWEHTRKTVHAAAVALEGLMEDAPERIASVYRQRAEKLAEIPCAAPPGTPVLIFRLENQRYGIELASVRAVLGALRTTPVPEAEEKLEGLVNVKGSIRPVLNLRFLLDLPPAGFDTPEHLVLLRRGQRELGIKVGEIERIASLPPAADRPVIPVEEAPAKYIRDSMPGVGAILHIGALFEELWNERSEA